MPITRLVVLSTLLLSACAPDPLVRNDLRDLDTVWSELQRGIRTADADRVGAVLAPSADPEMAQSLISMVGTAEENRGVRAHLLQSDVSDLRAVAGETGESGQIYEFQWVRRVSYDDGLPDADDGFSLFFQVDNGAAGILRMLSWTRRVEPPDADHLMAPQTAAELWSRLVAAVMSRDADGIAALIDPSPGYARPSDLAMTVTLFRWSLDERYADAFRAALRDADPADVFQPDDGTPRFVFTETDDEWPANYIYFVEKEEGVFIEGLLETIHPDADRRALAATWPAIVAALRAGDADALAGLTSTDAEGGVVRAALAAYGPEGLDRDRFEALARAKPETFMRENASGDGRIVYAAFPDFDEVEDEETSLTLLYLTIEDGRALLFSSLGVG